MSHPKALLSADKLRGIALGVDYPEALLAIAGHKKASEDERK
jgi:hypothetical protein